MGFGSASLRIALMLCMAFGAGSVFAQETKSIPWSNKTFSMTAVDEDIGRLLRRVIQADGKRLIVKPGVSGTASVQFQNMPLQAAFNQLVEENNLDYSYSAGTKTVTIFSMKKSPVTRHDERDFITPQATSFATIRKALKTFGLVTEGVKVTYDSDSNTMSVFGWADRVADIRNLVERLDNGALARRQQAEERQAKASALGLQRQQTAQAKQQAAKLAAQAEFERQLVERVLDFKVKVIRLRFATVGTTEKKFQDKTFTVPGIEETLRKILGFPVQGSRGPATTSPAQRLLGQSGIVLPGLGLGTTQPAAARGSTASTPALSRFAGALKPVISVDPRTNSVIVRGTAQAIAEVEKIIKELDKPLRMIEIEVVIVKADSTVTEELGIAYLGQAAVQRGTRGRSGALDTGITAAERSTGTTVDALSLLPVQGSGTARNIVSFFTGDQADFLQAEIKAFAENNRAQVISAPRVVTLDNVTARVTKATNLFFQVPASGDAGTTLAQIETGLELSILPSIIPSDVAGEQNLIRLTLTARNSTPSTAATGAQVDVASSEVQTQVLIPDGGTFVMAGLFDDTRAENENGIPFLKDIPYIGALFRTNSSSDTLTETIFFITPRIVDERRLTRDIAARVGTREYMKRQRNLLSNVSRQAESSKTRYFPNVLNRLEEDE